MRLTNHLHCIYFVLASLALFSSTASAIPITTSPSYNVELYADGLGAVTGLTMDSNGNLYAADYSAGNIWKITEQNNISTYASGIPFITDLAFTNDGRLFASSSTGSNSNILEVLQGGTSSVYASGFSYPTSIESWGNELFVTNSGNGTITRIDAHRNPSIFLSGFSSPNGPYGISLDDSGTIYFLDHATGTVYSSDLLGNISPLSGVSVLGGTFTGIGFNDELFVSDVITGNLMMWNGQGGFDIFATGFAGKGNPPGIGPNDFIMVNNALYVGDGENIWRITAVPEPSVIALLLTGLLVLVVRQHQRTTRV